MKTIFILLSICLFTGFTQAQVYGSIVNPDGSDAVFDKVIFSVEGSLIYAALTDFDGRFRINCVRPGTYQVKIRGDEHDDFTIEVTIDDREIIFLDPILVPEKKNEIIGCNFGTGRIKLDPFGGSTTVINRRDIKQR